MCDNLFNTAVSGPPTVPPDFAHLTSTVQQYALDHFIAFWTVVSCALGQMILVTRGHSPINMFPCCDYTNGYCNQSGTIDERRIMAATMILLHIRDHARRFPPDFPLFVTVAGEDVLAYCLL